MAKYESAIPYIQKAEGGLSRATTDNASKDPSPYTYNGVTGWHTNRGITWSTFKNLATAVPYSITQDNFIKMPDSIWLGIYKKGYWDDMKGDLYNSQAIANAVVDFAWASGGGGSRKSLAKFLAPKGITAKDSTSIANGFNELIKKEGESKVFSDLIDHRKNFFISLNQPANQKGWLSRMDTLKKEGLAILDTQAANLTAIAKFTKKNWIPITVTVIGLTGLLTVILMLSEKRLA